MVQSNGTAAKTSFIVNDGEGMACEHCRKAKEDVICITVGIELKFISLSCLVEAATLAIDEGQMTVMV